jgi:hypothetical protein
VVVPSAIGEPAVGRENVAAVVGETVAVGVRVGIARAVCVDCAW